MANTFLSSSHNSVYAYFQGKKVKPADAFLHISGGTAAGSSAVRRRGKGDRNCIHCPDASPPAHMVEHKHCTGQGLLLQQAAEKGRGREEWQGKYVVFIALLWQKARFPLWYLRSYSGAQKMHLLDYQEKSNATSMHYCSSTKST